MSEDPLLGLSFHCIFTWWAWSASSLAFLSFFYPFINVIKFEGDISILPKLLLKRKTNSVQFSSVTQSCLTLCDPMNCSTPGLPVHHQLPEFTQTHIHRVSDAIQSSHPLLSPSPPAPNPSLHQSLFQ